MVTNLSVTLRKAAKRRMNNRLDNLFSPEKLRKRWEKKPESEAQSEAEWKEKMENRPVRDEFTRISKEILASCRGEKRQQVMAQLLRNIQTDLDRLDAEKATGQETDVFSVIDRIQQLEDLLAAYLADQREL